MHPILHITRMHTGVDMEAVPGEPIRAAAAGVVAFAGVRGGYGNTVIIDHGNQFATLYGHASALRVSTGQSVQAGQIIALAGSTGLATGPHLHFEVRILGKPVDPAAYL
jgi:murein DD-endopeptidase MepM/ murein hydrolase activator NlpD